MTRDTGLLACPFCGGQADGPYLTGVADGAGEFYTIDCVERDCSATITERGDAATVAAWNRRPTLPSDVAAGTPQGRCEMTMTERFANPACKCPTYAGNLGPCKTFERGAGERCVYCDHTEECHAVIVADVADVADIRARYEAATEGPWRLELEENEKQSDITAPAGSILFEPVAVIPHDDITDEGWRQVKANARFIAHARSDIPYLLDTVATLTAECERLRADGYRDGVEAAAKYHDNLADGLMVEYKKSKAEGVEFMSYAEKDAIKHRIYAKAIRARALQPAAATGGEASNG